MVRVFDVPLFLLAGLVWVTPAMTEPALRRVVLSSGGVGQFEFDGEVDGGAGVTLDVPLDQVDDVLKSLVVDDPAGPFLGVRLPGQQPLSESFRTLPFKPDAFASPEALLGSLVGESVRIPSTGARGAILSVSPFEVATAERQQTVTRHRLAIATGTGLATTVLEDTPDIEFTSEPLRAQVGAALSAIAAQRVQDRRLLTLSLRPGQPRHVRFGYVVPVPVWKTSYRLTMPANDTGSAHLQAYAVVENLSGRDWHDVSVTLTSGRPVLFHTPLYQSLFTTRPDAPVDVPGAVAPSVDAYQAAPPPGATFAMAAPAPAPSFRVARSPVGSPQAMDPVPPPPSAVVQSVANVEFRLSSPVTASSGQSLLLPILDRHIPADRVAYFQPATDPVHPLVALRLNNDGPGALPPGLITLFDRQADGTDSYVGDARLSAIQPGEQRLASFAVDLAVTVEDHTERTQRIVGGTIARGVLTLMGKVRRTATYLVTTPKSAGRTVVIDQPKIAGHVLVEPTGKGVSMTPDADRVSTDIPAGVTRAIRIVTEAATSETTALLAADAGTAVLARSGGALPGPLRQALEHAAALRADLDRDTNSLDTLRTRVVDVTADQGRIRSNLAAVPANSELQRQYLATLQAQENELASLDSRINAARKAADAADQALRDYVMSLKL